LSHERERREASGGPAWPAALVCARTALRARGHAFSLGLWSAVTLVTALTALFVPRAKSVRPAARFSRKARTEPVKAVTGVTALHIGSRRGEGL
jgi:hypothetical protein